MLDTNPVERQGAANSTQVELGLLSKTRSVPFHLLTQQSSFTRRPANTCAVILAGQRRPNTSDPCGCVQPVQQASVPLSSSSSGGGGGTLPAPHAHSGVEDEDAEHQDSHPHPLHRFLPAHRSRRLRRARVEK